MFLKTPHPTHPCTPFRGSKTHITHFFYLTTKHTKKNTNFIIRFNSKYSHPLSCFSCFSWFPIPITLFYLTTKHTKHTKNLKYLLLFLILIPIPFRAFRAFRGSKYPSHKHSCQLVHIRVLENTTPKPIRVRHFVVPKHPSHFFYLTTKHTKHTKNLKYLLLFLIPIPFVVPNTHQISIRVNWCIFVFLK